MLAGTSASNAASWVTVFVTLPVGPPPLSLLLEHPARASDALVTTATVTANIRERCDIQGLLVRFDGGPLYGWHTERSRTASKRCRTVTPRGRPAKRLGRF